jgi:hypothetical protein
LKALANSKDELSYLLLKEYFADFRKAEEIVDGSSANNKPAQEPKTITVIPP